MKLSEIIHMAAMTVKENHGKGVKCYGDRPWGSSRDVTPW
jgi:hypothetical protein